MRIARGISIANTSKPVGITYDADAAAFFTAANITDTTQKNAVNQLVLDLKAASIWTKMKALYPVVGGVASAHAVNLKTPGTYNLTFATGWTHSSTGMTPNGATYANTNLIPSTALTLNNAHISYYSRTSTLGSGNKIDMGSYYANSVPLYAYMIFQSNGRGSDNNTVGYISMDDPGLRYTQTNAAKFITTTRTADNSIKIIENGVVKSTNTTVQTSVFQGLPQISIYLGALNYRDSLTPQNAVSYSQKECAFASIGNGLTDAEASSFYNAVQTYQTTLGRQV